MVIEADLEDEDEVEVVAAEASEDGEEEIEEASVEETEEASEVVVVCFGPARIPQKC